MPVITVDPEKCTGTGICGNVCPKGPMIWDVVEKDNRRLCVVVDVSFCLNCKMCATRCPTGAILVKAK